MLVEIDEELLIPQCLRKDRERILASIKDLEDKLELKPHEETDLLDARKTLAAIEHLLANWY
jgi:hypothetical protein